MDSNGSMVIGHWSFVIPGLFLHKVQITYCTGMDVMLRCVT